VYLFLKNANFAVSLNHALVSRTSFSDVSHVDLKWKILLHKKQDL
jgi:hypothetical protein